MCAVQLLCVLLSKGISHANCVLDQIEDCVSGASPAKRFIPGFTQHRSVLSQVLCEPVLAGCWVLQHPARLGAGGCWVLEGAGC